MQVLENWQPKGVTVYMDDKRFINCVLTECRLVYGGGDVTGRTRSLSIASSPSMARPNAPSPTSRTSA